MEFWFSGELDYQVSVAYREIRKDVEATLNRELGSRLWSCSSGTGHYYHNNF